MSLPSLNMGRGEVPETASPTSYEGKETGVSPVPDLMTPVSTVLNHLQRALLDEVLPLKPWEFAILQTFNKKEGWTGSQLARRFPTNPSRISRVVSSLQRKGLVDKKRSPVDQRVVHLFLTEDGKKVLEEVNHRTRAVEAKLTADVTPDELKGFLSTIRKIKANHIAMDGANIGLGGGSSPITLY